MDQTKISNFGIFIIFIQTLKHEIFFPADKKPRMSYHEESYLLQSINKSDLDSFTPANRRIYRKLAVRKLKREYSLPIFDIDRFSVNSVSNEKFSKYGNRVLDRFSCENLNGFFEQRLAGHHESSAVHSPYTNRLLKPFIRRDETCTPLWLRVTEQLCAKANRNNPHWKPKPRSTIDYCYVRPHHIPAVNSLCSQFFWPGIDRKFHFQKVLNFFINFYARFIHKS